MGFSGLVAREPLCTESWSRSGSGKSGGARVIYFNLTVQEVVLLIAAYAKADRDNMLPADIKKVA